MVFFWNKVTGVIFILCKITSLIQCCSPRGQGAYFSVYYVEFGRSFSLAVDFKTKVKYTWRKDGKPMAIKNFDSDNDSKCAEARIYTVKDNPSIVFRKIALKDSGKYILELPPPIRRLYSFQIIVQAKSIAYIDCNDMTVYEGDNISCICTSGIYNSNATVRWLRTKHVHGNTGVKNFTDILTLENISRNESGTYTCFAKSDNLVNKTSFNLKVVPKTYSTTTTVEIEYFKVFQEVKVGYSNIFLLCKAEGFPEPNYMISHNGTAVKYGNMYTINTRNISSLGQYECLARNGASSDNRSLFLNASFLVGSKKVQRGILYTQSNDIEWKITSVVGVCSFFTGIIFVCILNCFCKNFCRKKDRRENSECVDVSPESRQAQMVNGGLRLNEIMGLRHASKGPGNEVRHSVVYDVPFVGNENNSYQELSIFRDRDEERYQSLNAINS